MSRRGASKRASRNTSKDKRKRRPQHEQQQHHPQEDTSSGVGSSICGRWRRRRFPTSIASTAEHQYRLPHMPEEKGVGDGGGRGGGLIARRGRKKAGVVTPAALFSALCAALLLVGALSFSRSQLLPSVATAARRTSAAEANASAGETAAAVTSTTTNANGNIRKDSHRTRNLARRPELKTRGGQLASARFSLLAEYPHDSRAFTQGLAFQDGFLYESTGLFGGKSSVRKVDPETGEVLQSVYLGKEHFGEGMVILGDEIYSLTWRSKVGFTWDLETFDKKDRFTYQTKTGQGWGITTDGSSLIVSDGSQFLFFWDPKTKKETKRIEVRDKAGHPLSRLNELEMIKGYIFANVWFDDKLYKIDPNSGQVVDSYNFAELYPKALKKKELSSKEAVLNGIAWDPEEDVLYLTGKLWPRLYKIKLRDDDNNEDLGPEARQDGEDGSERLRP